LHHVSPPEWRSPATVDVVFETAPITSTNPAEAAASDQPAPAPAYAPLPETAVVPQPPVPPDMARGPETLPPPVASDHALSEQAVAMQHHEAAGTVTTPRPNVPPKSNPTARPRTPDRRGDRQDLAEAPASSESARRRAMPEQIASTAGEPVVARKPAPTISPDWQNALGAWLGAHKRYPEPARRRAEQGRVVVRFTVTRDGQVLDVALVDGSGFPALDEAAQTLIRNAQLPAFPASMTTAQVNVTVPIQYSLER